MQNRCCHTDANQAQALRGSSGHLWAFTLLSLVAMATTAVGCHSHPTVGNATPTPTNSATGANPVAKISSDHKTKPSPYRPHVAEIDLSGGLPESAEEGMFSIPKGRSFSDLVLLLQRARAGKESKIKAVLVKFGGARIGFGQASELARLLQGLRKNKYRVVCHAHQYTNSSYWIAAKGCDEIWLSPAGGVDTIGIAGQVLYAKRLLEKLHVDVNMLQVGKYKGAEEPFTRDGPSPEAKESLVSTLRKLREIWLSELRKTRGNDAAIQAERGPFTPDEAKKLHLIDHVGYVSDAATKLETQVDVKQTVRRFGHGAMGADVPEVLKIVRTIAGAETSTGIPHVAVLRTIGSIGMGGEGGAFGEGGIAASRVIKQLRRLERDEQVKAVVVRIDSPGGSALASDLMWKEMMRLRKTKPVIVSIGNMAASGGYYLASAGTRIFAEPTSIVGSIGVVGGKFAIGRGLDEVGISSYIFPASSASGAAARAAYLSPFVPWNDEMKQRVLASMSTVYDLFLQRVAEGRHLSKQKVMSFAKGRIFAAKTGIQSGMVDELGGLSDAITYAKIAGGVEPAAKVQVLEPKSPLLEALGMDDENGEVRRPAPMNESTVLLSVAKRTLGPDMISYTMSLRPLMNGEHVLVSVPFALIVR